MNRLLLRQRGAGREFRPEKSNPTPTLHKETDMKTITTLLAVLATASALFAAPAVQAAQADSKGNSHAALPFYGYDHQR